MSGARPGGMGIRTRIWLAAIGIVVITLAVGGCRPRATAPVSETPNLETLAQRAREPSNDIQSQIDYGEALVKEGRLGEATSVFMRCEQAASRDSRPIAWLGMIAVSEHRPKDARRLFGEALQRNSDDLTALRGLANLDAQVRRVHHAIAGFNHLLRLRPKDADAWQRLGILCMADRQYDRSLGALQTAAELDPNDLVTNRFLGIVELHAGRLDEASRTLRAVLARQPDDAEVRAALANAMMRMDASPKGLAAAEKEADSALSAHPFAEGYRTRGQIYTAQRRFDAAIQDYQTAIKMEPKTRYAYLLLSQCYASAGKPDLARKASSEYQRLTKELLAKDKNPSMQSDPEP